MDINNIKMKSIFLVQVIGWEILIVGVGMDIIESPLFGSGELLSVFSLNLALGQSHMAQSHRKLEDVYDSKGGISVFLRSLGKFHCFVS